MVSSIPPTIPAPPTAPVEVSMVQFARQDIETVVPLTDSGSQT